MSTEYDSTLTAAQSLDADAAPPPAGPQRPLPPGERVGDYDIVEVLGQGAFGVTYLARDRQLQTRVAVKEYMPSAFSMRRDDGSVAPMRPDLEERFAWGKRRFLDEARTLSRLRHPNIVRLLAYFEERCTAYFAMDYEAGETLKTLLGRRETLEQQELLAIALPLLDGLDQVHGRNYLHRDIKPGNIVIRTDGGPVLLDFGSSRLAMKNAGTVAGEAELTAVLTPGYAPHEQYHAGQDKQGPWSDVYALAGVLYRAATGHKPVDAVRRANAAIAGDPDPLPPAALAGKVQCSQEMLQAIDAGLALAPKDRPQSAAEWRKMLEQAGKNTAPRRAGLALQAPAPPAADDEESLLFLGGLAAGGFQSVLVAGAVRAAVERDAKAAQLLQPAKLHAVHSGAAVLKHLRQYAVDLLLLDADLQDMSGLELLEKISRQPALRGLPVLMIAGNRGRDHLLRSMAAGAAAYLTRPYFPAELRRRFELLLDMLQYTEVEESQLAEASRAMAGNNPAQAAALLRGFLDIEEQARSLATSGGGAENEERELYDEAMTLAAREEMDEAMAVFGKASRSLHLLERSYAALARALKAVGDVAARASATGKAEAAAARLRQLEEEKQLFLNGIREHSRGRNPFNVLGLALRSRGDGPGSVRAYRKALELSPEDAAVNFNLALALAVQNQREEALEAVTLALHARPDLAQARTLYARLCGREWEA